MNADFTSIRQNYDRAVVAELPGGRTAYSYDGIDEFWMGLRASFPNAKFEVHHTIGLDEKMLSPRSAIRWSLSGKHDGLGAFGKPTGADVYIMGISHASLARAELGESSQFLMRSRSGSKYYYTQGRYKF